MTQESTTCVISSVFEYNLTNDINKKIYHEFICDKLRLNIITTNLVLFLTHRRDKSYAYCSNFYFCDSYCVGMLDFLLKLDVDIEIATKISNHVIVCSEQAIMIIKAIIMKDYTTVEDLLNINNPSSETNDNDIKIFCKRIKEIGRRIKNFNQKIWNNYLPEIVIRILLEKFRSNNMKSLIMQDITDVQSVFAEAASYDNIWGIGVDDKELEAHRIISWKGYNMLGYGITAISRYYLQIDQSIEAEERFIQSFCNIFIEFVNRYNKYK